MNTIKKAKMKDQILKHGFDLLRIFKADTMHSPDKIGPVDLAKKVHRIEARAHRIAEQECNGTIDTSDEATAKRDKAVLDSLDRALGFRALGIPVFINGDPRGYALKIDDKYVREHDLDIHRDWGGYGVLAPEFTGE